jgi:uncharacterized glyoxalase superfamily protein PhnB
MFMTFQVENAHAEYLEIGKRDVEIAYPLTDEPWGQRRFAVVDPAGTWVDIVQQIDPEAGFWERYMT